MKQCFVPVCTPPTRGDSHEQQEKISPKRRPAALDDLAPGSPWHLDRHRPRRGAGRHDSLSQATALLVALRPLHNPGPMTQLRCRAQKLFKNSSSFLFLHSLFTILDS